MLARIACHMPMEEVTQHGCNDGVHFASDGSVKGTKGAFGWVSATPDGHGLLANSDPARGT